MADTPPLTPELVVGGYAQGYFPMARSRRSPTVDWYDPDPRAILPLDGMHVSRSLRRVVARRRFEVTFDAAFVAVMQGCAAPRVQSRETWINNTIVSVYARLHDLGVGHSVEAWLGGGSDRRLVGGVYGLALGGAFFGESMFSRANDASKVCLVHLVERLRERGFMLFDTQIANAHTRSLGVIEISRAEYKRRLAEAIRLDVDF